MKLKQIKLPYLFLLPSLAGVSIFLLLPYIDVFKRAFFSVATDEFAGMDNFKEVMANDAFRLAMKNTTGFIAICVPLIMVLSLSIAVFIYENPRTGGLLKTSFLIPMAIPVASVVLLWKFLFDYHGILNGVLDAFGAEPVNWMNSGASFWILIGSYIWRNLGYDIILWLAALSAIDQSCQEAAKIDGASNWQRFHHVTLPSLKGASFVIVVLALLNAFKVFREAYLVSGNYPHDSSYMIQHLFNNWFRELDIDKMAAGAVINSIILIVLILLLQRLWEKRGKDA